MGGLVGMNSKTIRVIDIAREFNFDPRDPKELIEKLKSWGYSHIKTKFSELKIEEVQQIRERLTQERQKEVVEEKIDEGVIKRKTAKSQTSSSILPTSSSPRTEKKSKKIELPPPQRPEPPRSHRMIKPSRPIPPESPLFSFPSLLVEEHKEHKEVETQTEERKGEELPKVTTVQQEEETIIKKEEPPLVEVEEKVPIEASVARQLEEKALQEILKPPEPPKSTRLVEPVRREFLKEKFKGEVVAEENQEETVEATLDSIPSLQDYLKEEVSLKREGKGTPRRREVVRGKDLIEGAKEKYFKAQRAKKKKFPQAEVKKPVLTQPKESKRIIKIQGVTSVQDLAREMGVKATQVLTKLIELGVTGVNINSTLDFETAQIVASEFNYQVENVELTPEELIKIARGGVDDNTAEKDYKPRRPVVTIMGHVDHGKTTLLDYIRKTKVAETEAGGITQHIGAYVVSTPRGEICFIDTPGHEAFTAMRARGAQVTDIVVLVVAADDGVMPQTKEAIAHARAAKVPIIVAINKIDLPGVNPERVKRQLADEGLIPEEWGGDTICVEVSARTGEGVDRLLEMILLQAEVLELKAPINIPARGVVLEAKMEKGRGPVANLLVTEGILKVGDYIIAGAEHGKVRALTNELGKSLKEAGPSTPVEVLGLDGVPMAGDPVDVILDIKKAQEIVEIRRRGKERFEDITKEKMEQLMESIKVDATPNELNIILRTDVQGSLEAIKKQISSLTTEEVKLKIIFAGVGGITENDVMLASAIGKNTIILGFNVRPVGKAKQLAEEKGVEIVFHNIIYELEEDIRNRMKGLVLPKLEEVTLGKVEVRKIFNISKVGTVAGCYVLEGKITRSSKVRLLRDSVQIWEGKIASLKRFKDDVKEVLEGYECGLTLDGYNDIKEGDIIEAYELREVAPS